MPRRALIPALVLLLGLAPSARCEQPPAPDPARVKYAQPDAYRALLPTLGDAKALQGLAAQLVKRDAPTTLRAIWLWARRNLRPAETGGGAWRSVSEMIRAGTRTGEAEGALAIGTLARAAGIPTVWVKTLDVDWLKAGAPLGAIRGRTFLELHLDGAWRLLDPVEMRLYERYDPASRLLPGDRLVFDKGGDPFALVLPNRAALYRSQVQAFAASFDVKRLPWGTSRDLLAPIKVFVAGTAPVTRYVRATCDTLGFLVAETFPARDFDRIWPEVGGRILIVTREGGEPAVPAARRAAVLPVGAERLEATSKPAYLVRTLPDETVVIYVAATDYAGVEIAVARALADLRR